MDNNIKDKSNKMISRKTVAIGAVVLFLVTAIAASLLTLGAASVIGNINEILGINTGSPSESVEGWDYKRLDYVRDQLIDGFYEVPDDEAMMIGAIKGMVESVEDPYTYYMTSDEFQSYNQASNGNYTGIGVQVMVDKDNLITVLKVFKGSPAEIAGMLKGDKFLYAGDEAIHGDNFEYAISLIRGEPGTKVDVTILRSDKEIELSIVRSVIETPDLEMRMLEDDIGYIWLFSFDENSGNHFQQALEQLKQQGMKALVLDLRSNPGGYLDTCVQITDLLIPEGEIFHTQNRFGTVNNYNSKAGFIDIPLVIIVNGNTASAAEVLSGAVKYHQTGLIIGETTFGKGIMQTIRPLNDGAALKLTTAKWYSPDNISIHENGIEPDIVVEVSQEAIDYLEENPGDLPVEMDNQLARAIQEIKILIDKNK